MSGEWYREEVARARARNALVPPHAKPTVHIPRAPTPTPVPSEVAETTAGEREVEALLYAHREDALTCYDHPEAYCCVCGAHEVGGHRSHLAHTLAALLDRVRREEGERIAQAIEAKIPPPAMRCCDGLAIAAETARGPA